MTLKNTLHRIPFLEIRIMSRDHPNQVMYWNEEKEGFNKDYDNCFTILTILIKKIFFTIKN